MSQRLKILINAYACSPYHGSEPGMGWNFVRTIAQHHDLWILTEKNEFEADITRYRQENPALFEHLNFVFIPVRRKIWLEKLWPPSFYSSYRRWQWDALTVARKLHASIGFDLVHQLNMAGFREPGYLWQLEQIPFVWGPFGNLDNAPTRMLPLLGLKGLFYIGLHDFINTCQRRFLSRPRRAAQRPGCALIAATPANQQLALELWHRPSTVISEVGSMPELYPQQLTARCGNEPLRLVWSGVHFHWKALGTLLQAVAPLKSRLDFSIDILGSGPETARWQALAQRLGVASNCRWHGRIPRERAVEIMASGHIFCITSLKDLTSTVILEALSSGVPVIAPDLFGFSHVLTDGCGIKIAPSSPDCFIASYRTAIERLANNEELRRKLSQGAVDRAREFDWSQKLCALDDIYYSLVNDNKNGTQP